MQEHLLYISELIIKDILSLKKIRAVRAIWKEFENTAQITFFMGERLKKMKLKIFQLQILKLLHIVQMLN